MIDFDKEWDRSRRSMDRTRNFIVGFQLAILALVIAAFVSVVIVAVQAAKAGPEGLAAEAGKAVAAFERARSGQ